MQPCDPVFGFGHRSSLVGFARCWRLACSAGSVACVGTSLEDSDRAYCRFSHSSNGVVCHILPICTWRWSERLHESDTYLGTCWHGFRRYRVCPQPAVLQGTGVRSHWHAAYYFCSGSGVFLSRKRVHLVTLPPTLP